MWFKCVTSQLMVTMLWSAGISDYCEPTDIPGIYVLIEIGH